MAADGENLRPKHQRVTQARRRRWAWPMGMAMGSTHDKGPELRAGKSIPYIVPILTQMRPISNIYSNT